ncbi:sensor histidine kinase [Streptoalloteichus tenebrarius]|uniref:sensor histidine kinase n=1 Tax=Streptoalloteichus tenebrarius (strain ATCC 17920 / DSM 40477 / JCM 4838 / CBS 697.72 / NBRC 16177 / NCIMB 11028 / NRRL B-12390 / A12253. 1 / ISP 5477) TaxID=1933 RepID=UPI0020A3A8BC|nr:sensor histidine kinase [Streptoalloteichus tenebrarius]
MATSWPWRCLCYLLASPLVALAWVLCAWPLGPWAAVPLGGVERWRLGWIDVSARRAAHHGSSPAKIRWTRPRGRDLWLLCFYGLLLLPLSIVDMAVVATVLAVPTALVLAPFWLWLAPAEPPEVYSWLHVRAESTVSQVWACLAGLLLTVVALYVVTAFAAGRGHLARLLLMGSREEQLGRRVRQLSRSRSRIAAGFELERRRIERDLHDGAQQRLTSLVMKLGLLRFDLRSGKEPDPALLDRAYEEARRALTEVRDLVRGIYPATLREEGLGPALTEVVEELPLPVETRLDLRERLDETVESTLYFAVCEALTNVVRHSRARSARLDVTQERDLLVALVADDGAGGADPSRGTGLLGIMDRVEAIGGTVTVSSPSGGPTVVRMEVPCGS